MRDIGENTLGAVAIICLFLLLVLCLGTPDLLDAIIYALTKGAYHK